jgi:hypothetical protein
MYSLLLLVHVISAVLLGSYLTLPWQIKKTANIPRDNLVLRINFIQSYTRAGHYSLILLLVSGGLMIVIYSAFPSVIWVVVSCTTLLFISAFMGMIKKKLRQIKNSEKPEDLLKKNYKVLSIFSWALFVCILFALIIMTNPSILL